MYAVDWEQRINYEELRKARIEKLKEQMKKHRLDAILSLRVENIRYMTSFHPLHGYFTNLVRNMALLPKDGEPALLITGFDYPRAVEGMPWIKEWHTLPSLEDPTMAKIAVHEIVRKVLEDHGLSSAVIGLDGGLMHIIRALEQELPKAKFVSANEAMFEARAIKTEDELKILRICASMVDAAIEAAFSAVKVGAREYEISAVSAHVFHELGAEFLPWEPWTASGERTAPLCRGSTDKIIRRGELIVQDCGCIFNGYHGDINRTYIVGKPTEEQKKVYATIYEAQEAIGKAIKPGVKNWEVHEISSEIIRKAGYVREGVITTATPVFGLTGHGLGTAIHEPPIIGNKRYGEVELKPGMVFACEPSIHLPGTGGVRIEEMYIVTETGSERITSASRYEELFK